MNVLRVRKVGRFAQPEMWEGKEPKEVVDGPKGTKRAVIGPLSREKCLERLTRSRTAVTSSDFLDCTNWISFHK